MTEMSPQTDQSSAFCVRASERGQIRPSRRLVGQVTTSNFDPHDL